MKIWYQHGSEHSANLVMIGHFIDAAGATMAEEIIDALTKRVAQDQWTGALTVGSPPERFGPEVLDLLVKWNVTLGPTEIEQFAYEVNLKRQGNNLVLTTEEFDVSAFLKVMFLTGARIEVYSAHNYPDTEHGRGR